MERHNLIESYNIAEIEKYLIKNPEEINKVYRDAIQCQTPLLYAVELSDTKTVKLLLDYGASINMYVHNRYSALGRSINNTRSDPEMIKLLLEYGANPNLTDNFGSVAIFYAMRRNFRKTIQILLDYDAQYNGNYVKALRLVEKIKLLNIKN